MFPGILQRHISFLISGIFFACVFFGFVHDANAAITRQAASGPWTGIQTGYTGSPDLQFYSPKPPLSGYNATYNYGCQQDGAGNLECHKMFPSEDAFDTYTCGSTTISPANLVDLGSAWLFNNCVFSGDNTPPGPPPVVALTALSSSEINVSWTPSSDSGSGMAFYRVYRFQGPCCAPAALPTVDVLAPQTTYLHTGLSANTWYGYYVVAYDNAGKFSSSTGTVYIQTPSDSTSPTNPSGLFATAMSTSQINLSWAASIDPPPNATGIGGYRIERCTGMGCTSFAQIAISTTVSYSDTGLLPSTAYTYRVRAYDNMNNLSGYSNTDSATTNTPLDTTPPTASILFAVSASSSQIDLHWTASTDASGIANYRLYREGTLIVTLGNTILAYSDTGLAPSTAYTYYLVATDNAGNPANSNTVTSATSALPDTIPPTFSFTSPAILLPSGTTGATLAGTTAGDPSTCRYSAGTDAAFTAMTTFSSDMAGNTTMHSQSITGLTDGTTYTYYVKCRDAANNVNPSSFQYSFQVDSPALDLTAPAVNITMPSGTLAPNTTSTTLTVITSENAFCRYNQGSDVSFSAMTNNLSGSGTVHTATLNGLSNGTSYTYFVRCQDTPAGNESAPNIYTTFFIPFPPNMNPTALFTALPASGVAPLDVSVTSTSYDTDGTIILYTWAWGDGSPNTSGAAVTAASHAFVNSGTYTITLTVLDNQGGLGSTTQQVVASAPPVPPGPAETSLFCAPLCTTDADCAPGNVCSLAGICVASGTSGIGPARTNGYMSLPDGSMSQEAGPFAPATAVFPSYVKSAIMSLETTDPAECQYTTSVGASYGSSAMQTFTNTGTTKHSVTLTGLSGTMTASKSYAYRVLCRDLGTGETNPSSDPYLITFEIGGATILTGWPQDYTCLINKNFVSNNIPYVFDICIPR